MIVKLVLASLLIGLCVATSYHWPQSGDACVKIDFESRNSLWWVYANKTMHKIPDWNFDNSTVINGSCEATSASLTILWAVDNATYQWTFSQANNIVGIQMVLAFVPSVVFNGSTYNETVEMSMAMRTSMQVNMSYQCDDTRRYKTDVTVDDDRYYLLMRFRNVRMQAFGMQNSSYSVNVSRCDDIPAPSQHPKNTLTVTEKNKTCILLVAQIMLTVPYEDTKGNVTSQIGIQNPVFNGSCANDNNYINIMMGDTNSTISIRITFSLSEKNINWNTVEISGTLSDDRLFPDAADPFGTFSSQNNTSIGTALQCSQTGSYMCNSNTKFTLNNNVILEMWELQYAAHQDNITQFSKDNISQCKADMKTNSIVPIAVGAALAGLVVIVLIAYLIGRRRNRKGYESV